MTKHSPIIWAIAGAIGFVLVCWGIGKWYLLEKFIYVYYENGKVIIRENPPYGYINFEDLTIPLEGSDKYYYKFRK